MRGIIVLGALLGLMMLHSCEGGNIGGPEIRVVQNKDLASRVSSVKPVKINLKRKPNGTYSWDISGNDVESILEADRQLRKEFEKN